MKICIIKLKIKRDVELEKRIKFDKTDKTSHLDEKDNFKII